jgi:hypothetical protein
MRYSMKSLTKKAALIASMTLALPAFAQVDGAQNVENKNAEFISASSFAMENCDVVAEPGELKEVIDLATSKMSPNVIVCVLPGSTNAVLNLKHNGLRLIALQPGLSSFNGVTYVNAPTVLFGFNIASIALDKKASGSVIAASTLGKAATMTGEIIMIGNQLQKGLEGPMGRMSGAMHLPSYARGLSLSRNNVPLSASQTGDNTVAGWLPRHTLSSNIDAKETEGAGANALGQVNVKDKTKVNSQNPGNIASSMNWFAQTKLVSHTSPNREGEVLKRGQDIPVYRDPNSAAKPVSEMIFVPLHAGQAPELSRIGVIFGLN